MITLALFVLGLLVAAAVVLCIAAVIFASMEQDQ